MKYAGNGQESGNSKPFICQWLLSGNNNDMPHINALPTCFSILCLKANCVCMLVSAC